jgi:hypothetical protein
MRFIFIVSISLLFSLSSFGQNVERMFQTDVQIYLQQFGAAPNGAADLGLRPVERMVPNDFKFEYALRSLFDEEITEEEEAQGFHSSTYGMQFEGYSLRKGIATVRFSQPSNKTDIEIGPLESMVFVEAVTKTARQFRFVKQVRICAVGRTAIESELARPFPRCPATR